MMSTARSNFVENTPQAKLLVLQEQLRDSGRLLVAYSGGVDSAFLAWAAFRELGDNMLAVLADSPSLARSQMRDAVAFAEEHGIPLQLIRTEELESLDYRRNDAARCFHCKDELFTVMERYRSENGFQAIAYGVNVDDQGDFRPGQKAARQHNVAAPLLDAGLTKEDIRALAREAGLRVGTSRPRPACLRALNMDVPSRAKRCRRWKRVKSRCESSASSSSACGITVKSCALRSRRKSLPVP